MANYLVIIASSDQTESVERWLELADGTMEDDRVKVELDHGVVCYYVAHRGKLDTTPDGGFFKGHVIDHSARRVIFSGSGGSPFIGRAMPGCYLRIKCYSNHIQIDNDLFSQLPMLFFSGVGVVGVSDSVLVLTALRRQLGLPNRANIDASLSRAWVHGLSSQLLGTGTLIDGISYAPPGSRIHVDIFGTQPILRVERGLAEELFLTDVTDYKYTLVESAQRVASVISALAQLPDTSTTISLSGGTDSRVCLAGALSHANRDKLFFVTNSSHPHDYPAVKGLSDRCGFDFRHPPKQKTMVREMVPGWFLSCAGIYDPLQSVGPIRAAINFMIGGHGAEVYKGNFGWRPLSAITPAKVGHVSAIRKSKFMTKVSIWARVRDILSSGLGACRFSGFPKVAADISEAAYKEASQGLGAVGIDPEDRWATEWHYLFYRNAIHAGRSSMRSLLGVSPLLQRELVGLSRSSLNAYPAPKKNAPSIVTDMLIALNPELALMPFDNLLKNMDSAYIEERSGFLGRVTDIKPYIVVGHPCAVNSGVPKFFLKLAADRGFQGAFTQDTIRKLVRQGYEAIPDEVRHAYQLPKFLVDNELPEKITGSSWQCIAAGKIMAFLLTD